MTAVEKIRAMQRFSEDMPDSRIQVAYDMATPKVIAALGLEVYNAAADDPRRDYAVCCLAISALVLLSREIAEGSSVASNKGFGQGEIAPSEISQMIQLSRHWANLAEETIRQLKAENQSFGWIDV